MSFAENLQYLRKRDKVTQEGLAETLGVSRQSVSKWETGEAYPETEKIIALCDFFRVSMDDLMRGDVASPQEPPAEAEGAAETVPEHVLPAEELPAERAAKDGRITRTRAIGAAVSGGIFLCAAVAFFCLGGLMGAWHPAWLVFLVAFALCIFVDSVSRNDEEDAALPLAARIFKGLAGMVMLLSVAVYLFIGFMYGIWHPSWVCFIIAFALMLVFDRTANAIAGTDEGENGNQTEQNG